MFIRVLNKIWAILTFRTKRDFFIVSALRIVNSIIGLFGLAVIIPVVEVLLDFDHAIQKVYIKFFYELMGSPGKQDFLLFLFLASTAFLLLTMTVNILTVHLSGCYFRRLNKEFLVRMLKGLIGREIEDFYDFPQTEFLRKIHWLTSQVSNLLSSISHFIAISMQIFFIAAILIYINPQVFIVLLLALTIIYSILSLKIRKIIKSISIINRDQGKILQKKIKDMYLNFRDIQLYQSQISEIEEISSLKKSITQANSKIQLMNVTPKVIIETVSLIAVIYYSFWYSTVTNTHAVLSNIILYVIAGYRLLPAVQQIYGRWNNINASIILLESESEYITMMNKKAESPSIACLNFSSDEWFLRTENLEYLTSQGRELFSGLNIKIPLKGVIQIEGRSGVGKSTLLEILIGLRQASSGDVFFNEQKLTTENSISLWRHVAFCSQHSKLLDDTLRNNILFKIENIDYQRYEQAIDVACLAELRDRIGNDFQVIGENLSALSGGEKQRVIIARAVYKRARILVLDEAFSAIDPTTARSICNKLSGLEFIKAIIFVSHRPFDFDAVDNEISL